MITNYDYSLIASMNNRLAEENIRLASVQAFNLAYGRGKLNRIISRLLGRQNQLETLSSQPISSHHTSSHIVSVPIKHIKGSLGRSTDFDAHFNPLNERSRSRWVSVASAYKMGIPLPPVELVQVGQSYYIRDGHHRISVAKSMDHEAIEARIVN